MGQEIHYCSACGVRLRSADFDRGEAVRHDGAAYCRACAAQAGIPAEPARSGRDSRNTTRRIAVAGPTSTARIPVATPRRPMEPVSAPPTPPALIWGGGLALGVAIALAAAMTLGSGSRSAVPEVVTDRAPAAVHPSRFADPARPEAARAAAPASESS